MSGLTRRVAAVLVAALLIAAGLAAITLLRAHREDLPWTQLDLTRPIGLFTGRKLAALTRKPGECHALLTGAGVDFQPLEPAGQDQCAYSDGVELIEGGSRHIGLRPHHVPLACPVAAALSVWEWRVLQVAARRHFGPGVTVSRIDHYGSYNCRRIYGRATGSWSEHATADAIDVAGFGLSDGRRISVKQDWNGGGPKAAFLRDVRDGACRLFSTVLSPDYNAAHHDHLHLDQAERGALGWRSCR